ncbi:MAG TPA: serine/threonine-protein kinase [Ktedonobacteraceae bacterium]|nr:serine/threonine-protein kinase [Ktedonobacteraceae bacterium]
MSDRVGQQVGNYHLVQLLGSGGFADVYLGKQVFLDSPAAIKLLHTILAQGDIERFRSEARTLVRLIHPHIIRILDFGLEGSTPFLVMDYAPNGNMRQCFQRGQQVPLATVVAYIGQVANALQYAHDEKIIHRDIKPENMLLGRQNEILLSDFGIAIVAQSTRTQLTQEMTGTIAYMAPEQIQAHPRPASDQYSLGIVAYEWLSGAPPFTGLFTEIAVKHMMAEPPSLREKVPGLLPAVEQVIFTALAKDPAQRFGSIQAFATALEQASTGRKVFSAPAPFSQTLSGPTLPGVPMPPLLTPTLEQYAQMDNGPTLMNTAFTPNTLASTDGQNALPTVFVPTRQSYNPVTPPAQLPVYQSPEPTPERKKVSRRAALITGLSAVAIIAGGGLTWEIIAHSSSSTRGITHGQTPPAQKTKTTTSSTTRTTQGIPGLLEQDTFHRPDQPQWGIASDGNRWGGDASTSNDFSIFNQTGQIHRTATGHSLYTAQLGTAHTDTEVLVTAMLNTFTNSHIAAMVRYQNDNHYYKVILDGASLHFLKRIDPQHGPTIGQSLAFSPLPQTLYTIRFRIVGTTLQAKAWQATAAEPANWMITTTDNDPTFQSGAGGLRPQLDQNVTLNVTMFQMTLAT